MDDAAFVPDSLLAHAAFIRRLARALLRDEHAAEDIVQDTWRAALSSPPRRRGPLGPWLATLARNFARRRRRSELRRTSREQVAARQEALPSVSSTLQREETLRAVVDAVLSLPEPYRSTVLQRFYEDQPPRAIATRGQVPVETVHTRLRRALARLRATLDATDAGKKRDWRPALLAYAGGEGTRIVAAPTATTLTSVLMPAFFLMNIKNLSATALLIALSAGVYTVAGEGGTAEPGEASGASVPALAQAPASAQTEDVPAPQKPIAFRRVPVSGPRPETAPPAAHPHLPTETLAVPIRVAGDGGTSACASSGNYCWAPGTRPIRESATTKDCFNCHAFDAAPVNTATTEAGGRCTVTVDHQPLLLHAQHPNLGASCLEACHSRSTPEKQVNLTPRPVAQVSVLVLRASGLPAAHVAVDVKSLAVSHEAPVLPPPAHTDSDGRCTIALTQGVRYGVLAREGKERTSLEKVRPDAGQPNEVVIWFKGGLSVSGTLRTAEGEPVAGEVGVWERQTEEQRKEDPHAAFHARGRTGPSGEFRIEVPRRGKYDLIGSADGHANSSVFTVAVSQIVPHARGDLRLTRGVSIAGVVVREDGTPVAAASLSATAEGSFWSGLYGEIGPRDLFGERRNSATSDARGAFRFDALHPSAKYTLVCVPDTKRPAARLTQKGVIPTGPELRLVITETHLKTGRILGRVVSAATGKPVTRFEQRWVRFESGKPLDTGSEIEVKNERGEFASREFVFGSTHGLAFFSDDHAPAMTGPVTISQAEHRVEVRLPEFGKVSVRVLEADGSPAAHAEVHLRELGDFVVRRWVPRRTDRDGRLSWEKVAPGRYEITASRDTSRRYKGEKNERDVRSGQTTDVEICLSR